MNAIDWSIVGFYFAGMIGLSIFLGQGQETDEDYYVGGRNLPWWAVGLSTMATQTSAISFMSIPAFVAIKENGGLKWLQFEMAVPIAMIATAVVLLPFFRRLELVSIYRYLENRFEHPAVRLLLSGVFQISRGLATGVGLYASAIVLSVVLGLDLWWTIVLMGVVTIIYDTLGGMSAVVYSDVIQTAVLVVGALLCIWYGISIAGGISEVFGALPSERYVAYEMTHGLGDGGDTPFWAYLFGGFFLYASYYGADQSQTQRELSTPTVADTRKSLIFNGFARFPLTVMYIGMGIAVGAAYVQLPELQTTVANAPKADYLIPHFLLQVLPTGVRAIIISAILAAAMSSLDSSLNSLSAATLRDFVERRWDDLASETVLRLGKAITVAWGIVIVGFAFLVSKMESDTVIEAINKVGSAFYGPILATFVIGVVSKRANTLGVSAGLVAGVGVNLYLWLSGASVHWMWWNLIGFVVTVAVCSLVSRLRPAPSEETIDEYTLDFANLADREKEWLPTYGLLLGFFAFILAAIAATGYYAA